MFAAEFHAFAQQTLKNWLKSLFADMDCPTMSIQMEHSSVCHCKTVINQLSLMALKNDVDTDPPALTCRYFIVTNKLLCSVSVHTGQTIKSLLQSIEI